MQPLRAICLRALRTSAPCLLKIVAPSYTACDVTEANEDYEVPKYYPSPRLLQLSFDHAKQESSALSRTGIPSSVPPSRRQASVLLLLACYGKKQTP